MMKRNKGVVMVGFLNPSSEPYSFCSGAVITDRHVLSAAHCFDEDQDGQVDPLRGFFSHEIAFELADGLLAIASACSNKPGGRDSLETSTIGMGLGNRSA